jgi:hypothetical protein
MQKIHHVSVAAITRSSDEINRMVTGSRRRERKREAKNGCGCTYLDAAGMARTHCLLFSGPQLKNPKVSVSLPRCHFLLLIRPDLALRAGIFGDTENA